MQQKTEEKGEEGVSGFVVMSRVVISCVFCVRKKIARKEKRKGEGVTMWLYAVISII